MQAPLMMKKKYFFLNDLPELLSVDEKTTEGSDLPSPIPIWETLKMLLNYGNTGTACKTKQINKSHLSETIFSFVK